MRRIKIWDAPVRLFHWAIVVLIALAWVTQEFNRMEWHVRIGYTILTLLLFRIVWGFVGSETARFSRFLGSPAAALRHLAHLRRREPDRDRSPQRMPTAAAQPGREHTERSHRAPPRRRRR